jgi:hypothetical protein
VVVKFSVFNVVLFVPTLIQLDIPSADDCHCIVPLLPVSVNVVLVPVHSAVIPEIVPETEGGFTVMVNVLEAPVHPLAVGVTVIVADIFVVPVFVAIKLKSPEPDAPSPIAVFELAHV